MQRPTQNQEPSTAAQRPQLATRTLNSNCCEAANSNLTNTMKTKIPHLILAGLLGTSISSQAAVVYQSDFTGVAPTLADVGLVKSAGAAGGSWVIDATNDQLDGVGGGNGRSNVSTIDSWGLDPGYKGFTVDVTFRFTDTSPNRFDFGLVDAAYAISDSGAWLSSSLAGAYGVGFSSTIGATDGLFFNNGSSVSAISTAQGNITTATQTFSMTITDTTWSYSLNGAPATTGTHTFDTSRSYRFTAHAQSNANATFDNITLSQVPEPSSTALLGLGGLALALRRRRA